jgi:hypothetical protein
MKSIVTEIELIGDRKIEQIPSIKDKALRINLNQSIYGTFAEIGAGQETVRHFFRAGASSGTIAKAMSAYDKDFSDAIYGIEEDGRYVTESRLKKMLAHETRLIEERLNREKHPNKIFFSYANTVATIDFAKQYKGHGWVGISFQVAPGEEYNEIILHIRFKETDARLQQETLGILGVNLIYGAFYKHNDPKKLLRYLYDHLEKDQIEIDTINFSGPRFANIDNRLMSLQLVKNGMTDAVMFGPDGKNILPAAVLYKKNILALRGSFRPVTKVNMNMYKKSYDMFIQENKVDKENTFKNEIEFPFNSKDYSIGHPTISVDGKFLFFASDMPGGKGGSDIYRVEILANDKFSNPVNLGEPINTEGNEMFPYVNNDNLLFFSSEGHVGLGGLDVFVGIPEKNNLYKIFLNVGKPVNSKSDDFAFLIDSTNTIGYF